MDTLNNVASAASKAVFGSGDNKQEPVSGAQGDVSKGEPYDAGNMDDSEQKKLAGEGSKEEEVKQDVETSGAKAENKAEGAGEEPEIKDPEGPGPKPLADVAREHGGDAGNRDDTGAKATETDKKEGEGESKAEGGESKAEGGESKGTGEEYVKSSGLAADGGDFDVTKPGAGREADRLMEEKGMHPNEKKQDVAAAKSQQNDPTKDPAKDASKDSSAKKDKPSLGERIKAKFRKH